MSHSKGPGTPQWWEDGPDGDGLEQAFQGLSLPEGAQPLTSPAELLAQAASFTPVVSNAVFWSTPKVAAAALLSGGLGLGGGMLIQSPETGATEALAQSSETLVMSSPPKVLQESSPREAQDKPEIKEIIKEIVTIKEVPKIVYRDRVKIVYKDRPAPVLPESETMWLAENPADTVNSDLQRQVELMDSLQSAALAAPQQLTEQSAPDTVTQLSSNADLSAPQNWINLQLQMNLGNMERWGLAASLERQWRPTWIEESTLSLPVLGALTDWTPTAQIGVGMAPYHQEFKNGILKLEALAGVTKQQTTFGLVSSASIGPEFHMNPKKEEEESTQMDESPNWDRESDEHDWMATRISAGPAFQWRMDNGVVFGAKTEAGIIKAGNNLKPTAAIGLQFGYGFKVF